MWRRLKQETGVRHSLACLGVPAGDSAFLVCASHPGSNVEVPTTISLTWHCYCSSSLCSKETRGPFIRSQVLHRSTDWRLSWKWPARELLSRPCCSSSRSHGVCGSGSLLDAPHCPQPGRKLHPDKSRKHQLLQRMASHNWAVRQSIGRDAKRDFRSTKAALAA